jgi:NarL family two-component system response regulator LiaR
MRRRRATPTRRTGRPHRARARATTGIVVSLQSRIDREGLVALLRSQRDFEVLGSASTSGETLTLCLALRPDVLVLGMLVSWPDDVSGVAAIRLAVPETQVLALAPHAADRCTVLNPTDPASVDACCPFTSGRSTCLQIALAHGALGAITRDVSAADLFMAVRSVARGKPWVDGGIGPAPNGEHPLTLQEYRVSRLVGRGRSNKEIARDLKISELTVKKHVGRILRKLELHDRLQLGLCVARHPLDFDGD